MAKTATNTSLQVAPPSDQPESIEWWSKRAKRSQAFPKHTLFGTALENVDRESLKDIQGKYIPEGFIKQEADRYPLPPHIKEKISGRDALESSRRELLQQRSLLAEADQQLKTKAEQALSFREAQSRPGHTSHSQSSKPSWLSEKDLEHSKEINIVGLNPKGSYNRDKYGSKPPRHNYSLIGDIMATSNDLNTSRVSAGIRDAYKKNRDTGWGRGRHLPYELMEQSKSATERPSRSLINLPPNIRHKFGSRVCDTLLSDKDLVNMSLERQKSMSGPPRPSKKENIEGLPVNLQDTYESLGQTTRYNVFPGLTTNHTISRTQEEFNDMVHLRRVPNPDEFRYQRDELSTWSEHNVLRDRMKKAWDEAYPLGIWVEQDILRKRMQEKWKVYFETLPKRAANWTRGERRPVILAAKPASRPKTKAKPKSRQNPGIKENQEDEVVFVTPPLTPPPVQEEVVELPKEFQRDDEFWKFFDQPLPQ